MGLDDGRVRLADDALGGDRQGGGAGGQAELGAEVDDGQVDAAEAAAAEGLGDLVREAVLELSDDERLGVDHVVLVGAELGADLEDLGDADRDAVFDDSDLQPHDHAGIGGEAHWFTEHDQVGVEAQATRPGRRGSDR